MPCQLEGRLGPPELQKLLMACEDQLIVGSPAVVDERAGMPPALRAAMLGQPPPGATGLPTPSM